MTSLDSVEKSVDNSELDMYGVLSIFVSCVGNVCEFADALETISCRAHVKAAADSRDL